MSISAAISIHTTIHPIIAQIMWAGIPLLVIDVPDRLKEKLFMKSF
jgi:hypothetical protein